MQNPENQINTYRGLFNVKAFLKKTMLTAFTAAAFTVAGSSSAAQANNDELTTVYYVYLNDQYAGTVSDKNVVEKMIEEKKTNVEEGYQELAISLGSEVSFVPEQVFDVYAEAGDTLTVNQLKEEIEFQAEAAALNIGGEPVAYVENEEQAKEVLKQLKLKYLSEKELHELEARKELNGNDLPPLKKNESRLVDVQFTADVEISEVQAAPENILSVKEAVKLLQKGTLEEKQYVVKEGDVLGGIAQAHNLETKELISLNKGLKEDAILSIGQELNVTVLQPYIKVVAQKEVFKREYIPYEKEVIEDSSLPKGDIRVKQEGQKGKRAVTYHITEQNGKTISKEEAESEVLKQPVKHIVVKGTKVIPSRGDGSFIWPANGGYVSSKVGYRWGKMHKGVDIARPSNRTIKAADNGVVVSAGWDGGYGNKVVIDHQNGFRTVCAHLSSITVSQGQTVSQGAKIGVMGSTGDSTGVHLHFELYKNGKMEDGLKYIR